MNDQFLSEIEATKRRWRYAAPEELDINPRYYWLGNGRDGLEVAYGSAERRLNTTTIRNAWKQRHGRGAAPLLLVVAYKEKGTSRALVCGPAGEDPTFVDLDQDHAERLSAAALAEPDRHSAIRRISEALEGDADEHPGLRNKGLLATHDHLELDKLLYWYVHSFLWGRYAGSTESIINQDLAAIEEQEGALDRLVEGLRQNRGDLTLHPSDFSGWSKGARFYPLLYLLTRTWGARDWGTGNELKQESLGKLTGLQLHHIFPKSYLYDNNYPRPEVNALANFTFLTQETNLEISARAPQEYFEEVEDKYPGALESQWIPIDRDLWRVENYRGFLEARRELLAEAANQFLGELLHGEVPEKAAAEDITERSVPLVSGTISAGDEEEEILACMEWVADQSLPEPEVEYELVDEATGEALAVFDLAWPDGLQQGFSSPVALLIDEPREVEEEANRAGYRCYTSTEEFKGYVQQEILGEPEVVVAETG